MANADSRTERKLEISQKLTIGRAALLMAAMIGLSRLTGFGRMMLVSHLYATGPEAAVFEAAFNIPDTITILIAGGALATGFVPVFTEYLANGQQEAARRTFRAMWTLLGAAFGIITIALFAITWTSIGARLAPTSVGPQYVELYLKLLRILLAAQFFFVVGGLFSGTLNALRLFWYPALQPVMFNVGIIVFGIALPVLFDMGIESQAWGALVGAIVGSLLIQMPAVLRNGLSLKPLWDLHDAGVRRVLKSLLPIVFGLASGQIIALNLPRFFAYGLASTELPSIGYANRLMQVPLDLLASGPAIALFPTLALLYAQKNMGELRIQLTSGLRRTLALTILATALLAALRYPVIHFLLEHGDFTKVETKHVAPVLGCYALCIVGLAAQQVLARGFYAMGEVRIPIGVGIAAMGIFAVFTQIFPARGENGAVGLALAAAVAVNCLGFMMWFFLKGKLGGWDNGATLQTLWKSTVAGVVAYYGALFTASYLLRFITATGLDLPATAGVVKYAARGGVTAMAAIVGVVLFIVVGVILKLPEVDAITSRLSKRKSLFVSFAGKTDKK